MTKKYIYIFFPIVSTNEIQSSGRRGGKDRIKEPGGEKCY